MKKKHSCKKTDDWKSDAFCWEAARKLSELKRAQTARCHRRQQQQKTMKRDLLPGINFNSGKSFASKIIIERASAKIRYGCCRIAYKVPPSPFYNSEECAGRDIFCTIQRGHYLRNDFHRRPVCLKAPALLSLTRFFGPCSLNTELKYHTVLDTV
jgi:hypothetical protein